MNTVTTIEAVAAATAPWREQRAERLARRHLDHEDFALLADAGYLRLAVPEAQGGTFRSAAGSTREIAGCLRSLAGLDPSVALVASMHPTVLGFWLVNPDPSQPGWEAQRVAVFETAHAGAQWGTVTSEPGSGGDITKTRTVAVPDVEAPEPPVPGRRFRLTGDKHFGSGTGVCSYMMTTGIPDGEDEPAVFFIDTRAVARGEDVDGYEIRAEWDGVGMKATQSHAIRLEGCPAVRFEWGRPLVDLTIGAAPFVSTVFVAVVLGVLDEVIATAREQLRPRLEHLRAYEQVEWSRAEMEHWLAVQAFEGALRAIEAGDHGAALHAALRAKAAVAELAESAVVRTTRVLGGGTFSQRSPFSTWFEDVRALGFLRPPWGLAFDGLLATSFG